jgi:hypothetical protein
MSDLRECRRWHRPSSGAIKASSNCDRLEGLVREKGSVFSIDMLWQPDLPATREDAVGKPTCN